MENFWYPEEGLFITPFDLLNIRNKENMMINLFVLKHSNSSYFNS